VIRVVLLLVVLGLLVISSVGVALADGESITVAGTGEMAGPPDPGDPEVEGQIEATVTDDTLDGLDEVDTVMDVVGTGTFTLTLFGEEPSGVDSPDGDVVKFFDVYCEDSSGVTSLVLRFYYTEYEALDMEEEEIRVVWWDGDSWEECSDQVVHTGNVGDYGGYVEVQVDGTTSPGLDDLEMTEFSLLGVREGQEGLYYLTRTLPFIWVGICLLVLLGLVVSFGYGVATLVIGVIVTVLAVVGVIMIQDVLWGAFS
jgi:hypothetical protein